MKYMLLLRTPADGGPQEGTPELADEMRAWPKMPCSVYGSVEIRPLSPVSQSS